MLSLHLPKCLVNSPLHKKLRVSGIVKYFNIPQPWHYKYSSFHLVKQNTLNILQTLELFHWHWAVKSSFGSSCFFYCLFCFVVYLFKHWNRMVVSCCSSDNDPYSKTFTAVDQIQNWLILIKNRKNKMHMIKIHGKEFNSINVAAKLYF